MEFSRCLQWGGMARFLATRTVLVSLNKVQWLHFTGAVDKFVIVWWHVSSGFSVPKNTKIGFWLSYFKKFKVAPFFGPPCRCGYCYRPTSVVCRYSVSLSVGLSVPLSPSTGRDNVWIEDSGGHREPRIRWGPDPPHGKEQYWAEWAAHC